MSVILIKFSHDLPTKAQNELRHRMEMARWKQRWRDATENDNYDLQDQLQHEFELVGLP